MMEDEKGKLSVHDPDPRYPQINWIPEAFHLLPVPGVKRIAAIMRKGERAGRGPNDWKAIPAIEHVNHALAHCFEYLTGEVGEDHLAHAGCRILMALALPKRKPNPDPTPRSGPGPAWQFNPWQCTCGYRNPVGTMECLNCDRRFPSSTPSDEAPFP